jgi:hypothetical protein
MTFENLMSTLKRLGKWRKIFVSWQLGTRSDTDSEAKALADHREATMLLRAESSAFVRLLIGKGVFTDSEWSNAEVIKATC